MIVTITLPCEISRRKAQFIFRQLLHDYNEVYLSFGDYGLMCNGSPFVNVYMDEQFMPLWEREAYIKDFKLICTERYDK